MSWLAAKAEELLQSAGKKAGAEIHKVKERAGILDTPAEAADEEPAMMIVLSQAAAALLEPEERERLVASGTATVEADGTDLVPSTPAAGADERADDTDHLRRARVAEWSALQQELSILSMHGRRMQSRLKACAAELAQARAAEAAAKRQLSMSNDARSAAEQKANEVRGSAGEHISASDARVAAAEAKVGAAERHAAEQEALAASSQEELAFAKQEVARAEEAAQLQSATTASVRLELSAEREQAGHAAQAAAARVSAAERLNEELQEANQRLSASMAEEARSRAKSEASNVTAATAQRLEAELTKARTERSAALEAERAATREAEALRAELATARRQADDATAAKAAAERALASAHREASSESEARVAAEQKLGTAARSAAGDGHVDGAAAAAAARSAAALAEREQRLEKLMSERTALRFQLEAETQRRTAAEKQLASGGGGALRIDIESSGVEHAPLLSGSRREREMVAPRLVSRFLTTNVRRPRAELVMAAAAADDLADGVDKLALTAGRHLRMHRALRLGAVGYLIMLHGWILVLLLHMMPTLPNAEPSRRAVHAAAAAHSL